MKRSFGTSTPIRMFGPKISENSTTTGSQMKRLKRDGSRPKHLRRGASHASSAQEYMKSEWTCDELDLSKQITSLSDMAEDKFKLVEELFSIFSILELKEFTPDLLKEYSVNQLKELCLEELNSISISKIKFLTEGNDPEDYVEPKIDNQNRVIGETADGIQLSVDDNEYSDFLGTENLEQRKPRVEVKDAEVQANWSSLESSSDDESHSDNRDDEGWMNLWKLEQMEILELEMRARAIRMLLKQQEEESTHKPSDENKSSEELKTNKDISDENSKTIDSNIAENETNNMSNKKLKTNNECDLEDGERPDSDNDSNFKDRRSKPKEDLNVSNNSEVEFTNDCNPTEESFENYNILIKDNNEERDVNKEFNFNEELNTNIPEESNAEERNDTEEEEDNENTEVFSIIKINEDFDEELMEENVEEEEEEEVNEETIDELEKYKEKIENLLNVCNPESDSDP